MTEEFDPSDVWEKPRVFEKTYDGIKVVIQTDLGDSFFTVKTKDANEADRVFLKAAYYLLRRFPDSSLRSIDILGSRSGGDSRSGGGCKYRINHMERAE